MQQLLRMGRGAVIPLDAAILFSDILTIPDNEIPKTEVLYTIVGGKVMSKDVPALNGKYVFGDYTTGAIWAMPWGDTGQGTPPIVDMGAYESAFASTVTITPSAK